MIKAKGKTRNQVKEEKKGPSCNGPSYGDPKRGPSKEKKRKKFGEIISDKSQKNFIESRIFVRIVKRIVSRAKLPKKSGCV